MDAALRFFDMADRQRFLNHLLSKNHLLYALEPSDSDSKAPNTIPIVGVTDPSVFMMDY
jgi:hypothetical protein